MRRATIVGVGALAVALGVALALVLGPSTDVEPGAAPVDAPVDAPTTRSRSVTLSRPVAAPAAPADAAAPAEAPDDPVVDAVDGPDEEAYQERLEAYQANVQRAVDCDGLFDSHVEPFLRVEERLLDDPMQGPDQLARRASLLATYEGQLLDLLDEGGCP